MIVGLLRKMPHQLRGYVRNLKQIKPWEELSRVRLVKKTFLVKYNMASMLELLLVPGSPNLKGVFEEVVPQQPPPSP